MDNDNRLLHGSADEAQPDSSVEELQGPSSSADSAEYIVRRLTPTECARLQGFPDDWCHGLENPSPSQSEVDYWMGVWAHWAEINGTKPKSENQVRKWLASPHSDSEEYKLWGNGIALPCLLPMMRSMAHILSEEEVK